MLMIFSIFRRWFPYYIVRFKQKNRLIKHLLPLCFHTTQYDLNEPHLHRSHRSLNSFHTTQYDLNKAAFHSSALQPSKFPYYIVRFKLSQGMQQAEAAQKFPYYIVRFKHRIELCFNRNFTCFHTTQYDLNLSVGSTKSTSKFVSILHSTI